MEIGAQLYTVRDFCKTLEGFEESLKKIADIGYVNVQVSGSCAFAPEWLDAKLKENGLRCVVTHVPADRLTENAAQVAKDHAVFDCQNIGLGYYNFAQNSLEEFLDKYSPVAKAPTVARDIKNFSSNTCPRKMLASAPQTTSYPIIR